MIGKKDIENFYNCRTIAVIGASRDKRKYGNMVFCEFQKRGYNVIPVNPNAKEVNGKQSYETIKDIKDKIDAVLIIVPSSQQEKVAKECVEAGIKMIWMHEHIMKRRYKPCCTCNYCKFWCNPYYGFLPFYVYAR